MQDWDETPYPGMIRNLPEVDVPVEGVRGWLLQGEDTQMVFFDIASTAEVPLHSHCGQWGFVVEGEMELTIGEETKIYRKGDSYFIPEGVSPRHACQDSGCWTGGWDTVVSTLSLHHWPDPKQALEEIHRVLKPGGQFLIFDLRRDARRFVYWLLRFAKIFVVPAAIRRVNEPVGSALAS